MTTAIYQYITYGNRWKVRIRYKRKVWLTLTGRIISIKYLKK